MEEKIYEILNELCVPFSILGRHYLVRAVTLMCEIGHAPMTKVVYPQIAKEYNTSGSRVERAIRHAIECVFDNAHDDAIKKYFGYNVPSVKGKLTNSEFIYGLVEYLRLHK